MSRGRILRVLVSFLSLFGGSVFGEIPETFLPENLPAQYSMAEKNAAIPAFSSGVGRVLSLGRPESSAAARLAVGDTWVIGQTDPNETVVISTDTIVEQDILILNNGLLDVQNVRFSVRGNIFVVDQGEFRITSGTFVALQDFSYQYGLQVSNDATLDWSGVVFESPGSWSVALTHAATAQFDGVDVQSGFLTWALLDTASATIQNGQTAGEFLPMGTGTVDFIDTDFVLLWLVLPDASVMDVDLPDGAAVASWEISPTSPFATGIPYTARITNCTDIHWGVMAQSGSTSTFRDSDLRVVGSFFSTSETLKVSGVANDAVYADRQHDWGDISFRFVDSTIQTWSYYPFGGTKLTLERCVFGEVLTSEKGQAEIFYSLCDGTGGYIGAEGTSAVFLFLSTNLSQSTCKDSAIFYAAHSSLLSPIIDSNDGAVMVLANTYYTGEPQAHKASVFLDARIEPTEGSTNATVPLQGSVYFLAGPDSVAVLDDYYVEYGVGAEPTEWFPTDGTHTETVRNGVLANWNTSGLAAGSYSARLSVQLNFTDPIQIPNSVTLLPGVALSPPMWVLK